MPDSTELEARLLAAHEINDHWALVALYQTAAGAVQNKDERCFFLTQAYVFALEQAHPDVERLRHRLALHGRI